MARLDLAEKRVPQDGRISAQIRGRDIDVRISTYPSVHGENVVLRILDKKATPLSLSQLGFSRENYVAFKKIIESTSGLVLVTGPTGSGKTTTLYSAINASTKESKNIMTIEDPIEYDLRGAVQSQVNAKIGVDFASSLRAILRQDPDIIYVGEIRDVETARIAVRAALTGHLVYSTIHTNDAVGAVVRLREMGIESEMIGSVLRCVVAQRLVRKICPRCRVESFPSKELVDDLGLRPDGKVYDGRGCDSCFGIGYKGRTGIYEMLVVDKEIRKMIIRDASEEEILEAAGLRGTRSMPEEGLQKVQDGTTSLRELQRVL